MDQQLAVLIQSGGVVVPGRNSNVFSELREQLIRTRVVQFTQATINIGQWHRIHDTRCKAASSGSRRTEAITFTGAFPAGTADGFTGAALRGPVAGEDFDGGSGHEDVIGSLVPAQL